MSTELLIVIALALTFDFLNGVHDSSNIVATMISSRAFRPSTALGVTAVAHFVGPFLFGVAVAKTIGDEIVVSGSITLLVLIACLAAPASGQDHSSINPPGNQDGEDSAFGPPGWSGSRRHLCCPTRSRRSRVKG